MKKIKEMKKNEDENEHATFESDQVLFHSSWSCENDDEIDYQNENERDENENRITLLWKNDWNTWYVFFSFEWNLLIAIIFVNQHLIFHRYI